MCKLVDLSCFFLFLQPPLPDSTSPPHTDQHPLLPASTSMTPPSLNHTHSPPIRSSTTPPSQAAFSRPSRDESLESPQLRLGTTTTINPIEKPVPIRYDDDVYIYTYQLCSHLTVFYMYCALGDCLISMPKDCSQSWELWFFDIFMYMPCEVNFPS